MSEIRKEWWQSEILFYGKYGGNPLYPSFPSFPAIVWFSAINLPKVPAVIHFPPLAFKGGTLLLAWILSLSLSVRPLCVTSSSSPTCSASLLIQLPTGAEVSEPPSTLLLSPPAHLWLSLLVVCIRPHCRRQTIPWRPQRWFRWARPIFKALKVFSGPSSASMPLSSSSRHWGKPLVVNKTYCTIVRWRLLLIKILLFGMTVVHKRTVITERRRSSLASEEIQAFFMTFSSVWQISVQGYKAFVRIKVWFLPQKPSKRVNEKNKTK